MDKREAYPFRPTAAAFLQALILSAGRWLAARFAPGSAQLLDGRRAVLREARADDAQAIQDFVRALSPGARRRRYFSPISELSAERVRRLIAFDASREAVLLALAPATQAVIGLAEYSPSQRRCAEIAVVVADEWQGVGLGRVLLQALLSRARRCGYEAAVGELLADNRGMLLLARRLGFAVLRVPEDEGLLRIRCPLAAA